MKGRNGLIASDHWATLKYLYDELNKEFNFDFDPCPLHSNFDGLAIEWGKSNFVNPPYNRIDKPKFIEKAYFEWRKGKTVVMLIPVSTSTKHFHEYIRLFIQQKTPEIANFMKSYHGVFCKPRFVKIYINNELFLEV